MSSFIKQVSSQACEALLRRHLLVSWERTTLLVLHLCYGANVITMLFYRYFVDEGERVGE